jgi:hypothetical protein
MEFDTQPGNVSDTVERECVNSVNLSTSRETNCRDKLRILYIIGSYFARAPFPLCRCTRYDGTPLSESESSSFC